MSLDFDRHPHLVNLIEIVPHEFLPDDFPYPEAQNYFRYQHPAPGAPLVEGHTDPLLYYDDYYGGVHVWNGWVAKTIADTSDDRVTFDGYGHPCVNSNRLHGHSELSRIEARLAVAAAIGGYSRGMYLLDKDDSEQDK